jgi:hypothetical protein
LPSISRVSLPWPARAVAGRAEEGADAGAGRADALGQVALRHQLELELAAAVQAVEHLAVGLAREAADDLAHAAGLEQRRQAGLAVARVVVDDGEVLGALLDEAVDEFVGNAGGAEAADENRGAVLDACQRLRDRARDLVDHEACLRVKGKKNQKKNPNRDPADFANRRLFV